MEATNKTTDLLKDRALGGAGTDATHGGNRSDAEPNELARTAEIHDYWEGRRLANRIAERRRLKRKAGEALGGTSLASRHGSHGEGMAADGDRKAHCLGVHRLAGRQRIATGRCDEANKGPDIASVVRLTEPQTFEIYGESLCIRAVECRSTSPQLFHLSQAKKFGLAHVKLL